MIPKHSLTNPKKNIGLSIINPHKYIKAHLIFGNHRHSFYEVLLILDGRGHHQIDFTDYTIQGNSVSFLAPGQVHNLNKSAIDNCIILIFNDDFIYNTFENSNLLRQLNLIFNQSPVLALSKNETNNIRPTILTLETELKKENANRDILFHALNLFLFQMLSCCKETQTLGPQPAVFNKKRYFDFLELVESNYAKEHSVKYYARQLNIQPKRLNEITQSASGDNALQLVHKRILIEAKRLLFYSNLSIKEIAYKLGFEDVSYFSKFFQKNVGKRPSAFQDSNPESTT